MFVLKKIASILFILFALGGILIYLTLYRTNTKTAYLLVGSVPVEINHGTGWIKATDGQDLSLADKVRTNAGEATVIFYDSIIVKLKKNTEISINKLSDKSVSISQEKGVIWNTFTDIFGINNFEVKTPKALATVRGTNFGVEVNPNSESIALMEGSVDVKIGSQQAKLSPLHTMDINQSKKFMTNQMSTVVEKNFLFFIKDNLEKLKLIKTKQESEKKILKLNAAEILSIDTPVLNKYRKIEKNISRLEALVQCLECQGLIESDNFYPAEDQSNDSGYNVNLPNVNIPNLNFNLNQGNDSSTKN
jgi:hypothetical protein